MVIGQLNDCEVNKDDEDVYEFITKRLHRYSSTLILNFRLELVYV